MAGRKKRKHTESSSLIQPQPEDAPEYAEDNKMSHAINTLQFLTSQLQKDYSALKLDHLALESKFKNTVDEHELKFKKLKPIQKKYVRDQGLYLVNEFVSFIGQIHGTGLQRKFSKEYITGKFHKLGDNHEFSSNCEEFLRNQSDLGGKSAKDIVEMFNCLCNKRNRVAHFEEPEDCLRDILKFRNKHSDMVFKCDEEVQYCLSRISGIAKHFIGPYRLQRLTCEFLSSFLASRGHSWKRTSQLENILCNNKELINKFLPKGMPFKIWISKIMNILQVSLLYGPSFIEGSKGVNGNYSSIQEKFQACVKLEMLPEKESHTLEYFVLESSVD